MCNKPLQHVYLYTCLIVLGFLSLPSVAKEFKSNLAEQKQNNKRPNIILIVGDDQGYADLGVAGFNDDALTPNLDALANNGVRFTQAYVTAPICNASRASLMSGQYMQGYGNYWFGGDGLEKSADNTLAETFKSAGYSTGYIGKVHYGKNDSPGSRNFPTNHGFEQFYGFTGGRKHYLIHNQKTANAFQKRRANQGEDMKMGAFWQNDQLVDQQGFSTELIGQHAVEFVEQHKSEPFFLQVAFNAVHNFTYQLPDDYLTEHKLKGLTDWEPEKESWRNWYVKGRYPNNPEGRELYLGQLQFLDAEIGKLISHLKKLGLDNNTVIVYLADNGGSTPIYADNGPLRGSKYTLYEGGIRVPLIIYSKQDFKQGKVVDNVVSSLDIYPTLLSIAGIDKPSFLDGQDITDLLNSAKPVTEVKTSPRTLVWDTGVEIAVRSGKWKYQASFDDVYAHKQMVNMELGEFLYDLENDIGETTNLIAQHADIAASLKAKYREWAKTNRGQLHTTDQALAYRAKLNL